LLIDNALLYEGRQDSIDRLERERELREQFVAILAHDLRGPLSTASTAASLLAELVGVDRRELSAKIRRSLERADSMIRDLLDTHRLRAGERLPVVLERCELGSLAREVATELGMMHGARFDVRAPTPLNGMWSAEELRRAIWNLAANAVKYASPNTQISISVECSGESAIVAIHNVGPVVAASDCAALFNPFARTRSAQTGGRRGWGLGLTLVRGCVEAHGGTVGVESSLEDGTTFTVRLPLDARPYQPGTEAGANVPTPTAGRDPLTPMALLSR
jgi:signal transduction histidine kinase